MLGEARKYLTSVYIEERNFYQNYHQNVNNKFIHAVSVPFEWFGWLLLIQALLKHQLHYVISFYLSTFNYLIHSKLSNIVSLYYLLLPFLVDIFIYFTQFTTYKRFIYAMVLQSLAWFVQVYIGHNYFEKNNPAMATRLTLFSVCVSTMLAWDF